MNGVRYNLTSETKTNLVHHVKFLGTADYNDIVDHVFLGDYLKVSQDSSIKLLEFSVQPMMNWRSSSNLREILTVDRQS